jgi:hypothetical protein
MTLPLTHQISLLYHPSRLGTNGSDQREADFAKWPSEDGRIISRNEIFPGGMASTQWKG